MRDGCLLCPSLTISIKSTSHFTMETFEQNYEHVKCFPFSQELNKYYVQQQREDCRVIFELSSDKELDAKLPCFSPSYYLLPYLKPIQTKLSCHSLYYYYQKLDSLIVIRIFSLVHYLGMHASSPHADV